jgi:hypothetical protein
MEEMAVTTTAIKPAGSHVVMVEMAVPPADMGVLMEEMAAMAMRITDFAAPMAAEEDL